MALLLTCATFSSRLASCMQPQVSVFPPHLLSTLLQPPVGLQRLMDSKAIMSMRPTLNTHSFEQ